MTIRNDQDHRIDLRGLPVRIPPPALRTRLRVLASLESQRRSRTVRDWLAYWGDRFSLLSRNFMRPWALPFAGGVFSAVVLFSTWVAPAYPLLASGVVDIPTVLATEGAVKSSGSPVSFSSGDVVVDVTVDDQGRMVEYSIVSGPAVLRDPQLRRRLENVLLFTQFVPATSFGQPMRCKLRLSLQSSQVEVRG